MTTAVDQSSVSRTEAQQWLHMYRRMVMIRLFEEQVNDLYTRALMPGLAHLYIGEEAVAVGVCEALKSTDYITSTHRGHGHCLAKGAALDRMFAELLGKEAGYCKGKGGSMHIADPDTGNLGANAIVGGSAGIATGAAFSAKRLGTGQVAVCFFGDGALGQGLLYEVMNMSALWKLPVIYVCENNQYAMTVSLEKSVAIKHLGDRGQAYGFEGKTIDGNDVEVVYEETEKAAAKGRSGGGATFLECLTYRWDGHFGGDPGTGYRSKEEIETWKQKCPIKRLRDKLIQEGNLSEEEFADMSSSVYVELEEIAKRAEAAPLPRKEVDLDSVFATSEVARG